MTDHTEPTYEGPFASTTRVSHLLTADDGSASPIELVRSIDTEADPDLYEALLAGALHTVAVGGRTVHLAVPVVCHNPVKRVLALLVPDALRWDEFRLRKELYDAMTIAAVPLPQYARNFHVLTDASQFSVLEGASEVLSSSEVTQVSTSAEDLEESKALARRRAELEAEAAQLRNQREQLEIERQQLDEVRARMDRERDQLDALSEEISVARSELEASRAAAVEKPLSLEQLNREAAALRAASGESTVNPEATQVVTDDQFIEVIEEESLLLGDSVIDMDVERVQLVELQDGVPDKLSELVSSSIQSAVKLVGDRLLAVAQAGADLVERLFADEPTFLVQLHEIDGYPIVSLLLACLDDRDQIVESIAWPLDPAPDGDQLLLETLRRTAKLRIALYGPTGARLRAVEIATPYAENVAWILGRAEELLSKPGHGKYASAKKKFESSSFSLLGTMRHNFTPSSFEDATSPSELMLAAGIVGYWSKSDTFQYLIANRCFPLVHFRKIQHRVVTRATQAGVFINRPLRQVALQAGIAATEEQLVALLIGNFAEASISIRENDLDAMEQWENWDALLGLGEELGMEADPDVVELAEVSLKRAQEAEYNEARAAGETVEEHRAPSVYDSLVVAKRSESTGVTYFLPNDAVLDTFDDLATMPREDLELLLNDDNGRLEAAQMLVERFGSSATARALEASEEMLEGEVEAMAHFVESKAGGLENELVRYVESGGTNGRYVAARGLAAVKSTSAIPKLLDALQGNPGSPEMGAAARARFASALAGYGDKLMPALTRIIKRDGPNDALTTMLIALEDREAGTLQSLSKDRSKNLREAARLARKQRESQSA